MTMKVIRYLLLVILLVLPIVTGCNVSGESNSPEWTRDILSATYVDSTGMTVVLEADKLESGYGLVSNDVLIRLPKPNYTVKMPVIVVNGGDQDRQFRAIFSIPSSVNEGYTALPDEYLTWITVYQPESITVANSICLIPVSITTPKKYAPGNYQVSVMATDASQGTFIQLAYQMPWYLEVK